MTEFLIFDNLTLASVMIDNINNHLGLPKGYTKTYAVPQSRATDDKVIVRLPDNQVVPQALFANINIEISTIDWFEFDYGNV